MWIASVCGLSDKMRTVQNFDVDPETKTRVLGREKKENLN